MTVSQEEMDRIVTDHGTDPRDWAARSTQRDEPIRAIIGPAASLDMRLLVIEVGEERGGYATVSCVDDDPRAHDLPVTEAGGLGDVITGIGFETAAVPGGTDLTISLSLDAGAFNEAMSFIFEYSTDGGAFWQPLGTSATLSFTTAAPSGFTDLRAAATQGGARGPWITATAAQGALAAPANLAEVVSGTFASEARLHVVADPVAGAESYRFTLLDGTGQIMALVSRATPEIDLDAAALTQMGALSRDTTVRLAAVDSGFQTGATAELVMPHVPAPGAGTDFVQNSSGVVTWTQGTPPADRWRVEWQGGSAVVETAQFWRGTAGWRDPLTFTGLDAFGAGTGVTVQFNPDPPPGGDK